ncbi:MAG: sortase [Chloroflexota bacterium]
MKFRTGYTFVITAIVMLITIWPFSRTSSLVAATPIFTGDVPADFIGPNVIRVDDPSSGVGIPDVGLPNAFPEGHISGWEMNAAYFEYDFASDILYVGIDCFEICGDADGDGNPGTTGEILDGLRGTDQPSFGGTESFTILFDTDDDCGVDPNSAFDVVVGIPISFDVNAIGAYEFLGSPFSPSTGFGNQLSNQVTLFANPSAESPDIELSISEFSTFPGFDTNANSDLSFNINVFMGSLDDDGIGEDYLPGAASCFPVIPPPPTPTPTPTEIPTETPTPMPTPTMPPPTDLPPTGPTQQDHTLTSSLSPWGTASEGALAPNLAHHSTTSSPKDIVAYDGPSPQRIQINEINLDSEISPMSWYYIVDQEGNRIPQWQVTDFAVGWHINSAHVGETGNVVMSGHNSIGGSVFQDLSLLELGDTISVWNSEGIEHDYVVSQLEIVPEEDVDLAQQEANAKWLTDFGDERLTLISCWPDFSSEYRVIVVAHRESAGLNQWEALMQLIQ